MGLLDLEIMQVRHGDLIIVQPKRELSQIEAKRLSETMERWRKTVRVNIEVQIVPHNYTLISSGKRHKEHVMGREEEMARVEATFSSIHPAAEQLAKHEAIRNAAKHFAILVINSCSTSREKSMALTKIEEAAMWANAAVARGNDGR